jgi:hypothetical protein
MHQAETEVWGGWMGGAGGGGLPLEVMVLIVLWQGRATTTPSVSKYKHLLTFFAFDHSFYSKEL